MGLLAQDRVVFLPWTDAQAGTIGEDYLKNHARRLRGHHIRAWKVYTMDTPGTPLARLGLGFGQRLNIWGHGAVGFPRLQSEVGGVEIDADDVVDRLLEKGLQKQYLGTIVAETCEGALGDPPFAKLLARVLWQRGFKGTCVLGYKGKLVGKMTRFAKPGSTWLHRGVQLDDGDGGTRMVKSSAAQERFFGWC